MSNPLRDLIASRVAQRDEDLIPLPKYMLAATISANTLDELHRALDQLALDFQTEWADREQVDSTDGRTSVILDVTCRSQTQERYNEQLAAWSRARRTTHENEGSQVMSVYVDYPVGRCADGGCLYPEPHRHGLACDTGCACRGIGAVTSPLGDDDLAECDWGYCNRPSVALRLEVDITGTEPESWFAVCSWHAGWDDYENEGSRNG